ncbi:hypothetical protein BZA05DRAFT_441565 [Tricharina praecox]|uniref:uncharacterized protein n=1 Tax=Tricharina praecox TaxID=43433 RepID=UPI00222091B6|nr:uncharacterized protein BZA05DRAFT_441565 [Tricharina praecox]KAI5856927.1 hypothetical protein BZA05DRAFT_441565 [Tricharina praecox]
MPSYSSPDYSHQARPSQVISITEINQMRQTLRSRRVNTLTELRRIESVLTTLPNFTTELIHEITDSWGYYVSSNNFLNELRGLTRQYPFSNELLEDAKARVLNDPSSSRSWNFAWLLLAKIKNDQLIPVYAQRVAYQPSQWGGVHPDPRNAAELANVLSQEWTRAVEQLLRHWPTAPAW